MTPKLSTPKFSVAIPVYNRSAYLRQVIASCLAQTTDDFEVVLSDDCSSEDLRAVAEPFRDPRIAYHRNEARLGATANHQRAVHLSTGTYVIALNSDDILLPNCLEVAGLALDERPHAAAVYFACAYLRNGKVNGVNLSPPVAFANAETLSNNPWLNEFHGTSPSCCLFRRKAFDQLGGYCTSLRLAYDWDLYRRFVAKGGGVVFLPQVLCIYRLHDEQMVQTSSIDGLWDMLDLWALEENAHWPAREMASLVISQCLASLRKGEGFGGIAAILRQVRQRKLEWRVLNGVPGELGRRLILRAGWTGAKDAIHYVAPTNREAAIEEANALLKAYGIV